MSLRDIVLEGVRPLELEALSCLSANSDFRRGPDILRRLEAMRWIDTCGEAYILTITGRALLDAR